MKPFRLLPLAALALAGCATPARDRLVWVSLGGSGPCTVEMDRRRFVLPADEAALVGASVRLAATRGGALVAASPQGLSFPCYRASMAVIERAGFRRIGYVSDFVAED